MHAHMSYHLSYVTLMTGIRLTPSCSLAFDTSPSSFEFCAADITITSCVKRMSYVDYAHARVLSEAATHATSAYTSARLGALAVERYDATRHAQTDSAEWREEARVARERLTQQLQELQRMHSITRTITRINSSPHGNNNNNNNITRHMSPIRTTSGVAMIRPDVGQPVS